MGGGGVDLVFMLSSLQLSPKKTWEGFIGGFFATIVFGIMVRKGLNFYTVVYILICLHLKVPGPLCGHP